MKKKAKMAVPKNSLIYIGEFNIHSGAIKVIDPAYDDINVWCSATIHNAKNGVWKAYINKVNIGSWGDRIKELIIVHSSESNNSGIRYKWTDNNIGVDSAQCGFFDLEELTKIKQNEELDKSFYFRISEATKAENIDVLEYGVFSKSGYGDGVYSLHISQKGDWVVAAKLNYIDDGDSFDESE